MKKVTVVIFLILFLASCKEQLSENQEMRNEIRNLEIEIASIKGSPEYMVGESLGKIEEGEYGEAISVLENLKSSFPGWNEDIINLIIAKYADKAKISSVRSQRE